MSEINSARKILETFREGSTFICLKDLAKYSGFGRASSRDFKNGFNYLVAKGVLKLQQSGWRSEERGVNNHPKTVILTANLYEVVDNEFCLDVDAVSKLPEFKMIGLQEEIKVAKIPDEIIKKFRECPECIHSPIVYLTAEKIPVCGKHWSKLSGSNYEW